MKRLFRFGLRLSGLLVIAALAYPVFVYQEGLPRERALQTRLLSRYFAKVQLLNGKVLLAPAPNQYRLRLSDGVPFAGPVLFSVGSQFKAVDHHWGVEYTISGTRPEGVIIDFDASGALPSRTWRSHGTVRLPWK